MPTNEVYTEWIRYAQMDLDVAVELSKMYRPFIEIICYHCQQSVEKILKAFWAYQDIEPPKTHDLEFLRAECQKHDESFIDMNLFCNRLKQYAVLTRYPNNIDLNEHDMKQAIDFAVRAFDFALGKMK